ncbi:hypothetical protein [Virgibacillus sediminis]|uniref:Uncharacterized protein n=1 Tax=Virgibacillus sediminis TaxID=202260 RepID=A0ABV7AAL8_9BACI
MNIKVFLISFVSVYVLISLPAILGVGYVIDWVPEATLFQKFKGYVIDGVTDNFLIKIIISCIVGIVVSVAISMRQQSK